MRTLALRVNRRNILKGVPRDSHRCMIVESIHEQLPEVKRVTADVQSIRFTDPRTQTRYVYLTPPQAQKALLDFDQGIQVEPFRLQLSAAEGYTKPCKSSIAVAPRMKARKKRRASTPRRPAPSRYREFGVRKLTDTAVKAKRS